MKVIAHAIPAHALAKHDCDPFFPQWLIWNHERNQWWKPDEAGYTSERKEAGVYGLRHAKRILCIANEYTDAYPEDSIVYAPTFSQVYPNNVTLSKTPQADHDAI